MSPGIRCPSRTGRIIFRTPKIKVGRCPTAPRAILERFASRAYRRPVTEGELARLVKLVDLAIAERRLASSAGSSSPCRPSWSRPSSSSGSSSTRAAPRSPAKPACRDRRPVDRRVRAGLPAVVLPLEQHARRRALAGWPVDGLAALAETSSTSRSAGCSATPRRRPWSRTSPASGSSSATSSRSTRTAAGSPRFDEPLREAMLRETELFFGAVMRDDSQHPRLPRRRLHLRERAAGAALRDPGRQGRAVPPRQAQGPRAGRAADAGEHPDGHVEPDADLAGEAGQVGARADPGHAAAPAAAECPELEGGSESADRGNAPPADGAASRQAELRGLPQPAGPARASASRTSTPSAPGATRTARRRSTPRARFPRASRSAGPGS